MLLSGFYSIILNDGASGCWRRGQMHLVEMEPHQEIVLVNIYCED
jgi:phage terminase small subunit